MNNTSMASAADDVRRGLHGMWASVAPGWAEHAAFIDARSAALTDRMLDLAEIRSDDRVLELACGPGSVGLAAARLAGEVVVSDVASSMTAIAAARAAERGLENVTARDLDLEDIDEADASFDVVLCREGVMLVPDPARAAGEIRRVLRTGGRAVISVWGPRERNPWLGVVLDAVSAQLGVPVPPPGVPGPFSLDSAEAFARVLGGAEVEEFPVPLRAASAEEWWSRTLALGGPLANLFAGLSQEAADELAERLVRAAAPFAGEGGVEFPGVVLLASIRR